MKRVLRDHYVNPDEATLVQVKIREQGTYKIIDKISVRLDPSKDKYWAELSNLAIRDANISEEIISQHEKMMTGGIWAIIDMDYDSTQMIGKRYSPLWSARYAPSSFPVLRRKGLPKPVVCSTMRNGLTYFFVVEAMNLNQKG